MDLRKFLKGNERVNVFDKGEKVYYKAMIMDITSAGFYINQPTARQGVLSLREREVWEFNIESGDANFFFSAQVLKRAKKGVHNLFLIEYPASVRRQQRRQFYRLSINLDVEYIIVDVAEEREEEAKRKQELDEVPIQITEECDMYKDIMLFDEKTVGQEYADGVNPAFTVDISGGGLQIVSERYLSGGTELLLKIALPTVKDGISLRGKVIRSFSIHGGSSKKYRAAVTFKDIDEKTRDMIIEFIFDQSRKRAK